MLAASSSLYGCCRVAVVVVLAAAAPVVAGWIALVPPATRKATATGMRRVATRRATATTTVAAGRKETYLTLFSSHAGTAEWNQTREKDKAKLEKRKKKKNKYGQFSKQQAQQKDPWDALVEESLLKNRNLQEKDEERRKRQWERMRSGRQRQERATSRQAVDHDQDDTESDRQRERKPSFRFKFPGTNISNARRRKDNDADNSDADASISVATTKYDPYDPTTFGYVEIGTVVGAHGVHGWLKVKSDSDFAYERLCCYDEKGATTGSQPQSSEPHLRHLKLPNKRAPRPVLLLEGRHMRDNLYLVLLEGQVAPNREQASQLRGATLYARDDDDDQDDNNLEVLDDDIHIKSDTNIRNRLEPDEYYVSDLVGLEVYRVVSEDEKEGGGEHLGDEDPQRYVGTVGGIVFSNDISGNAKATTTAGCHDLLEIVLKKNGKTKKTSTRHRREEEYVLVPFVPQLVPTVDLDLGQMWIDPPSGLLDLTYQREEKVRIKGFLPPAVDAA